MRTALQHRFLKYSVGTDPSKNPARSLTFAGGDDAQARFPSSEAHTRSSKNLANLEFELSAGFFPCRSSFQFARFFPERVSVVSVLYLFCSLYLFLPNASGSVDCGLPFPPVLFLLFRKGNLALVGAMRFSNERIGSKTWAGSSSPAAQVCVVFLTILFYIMLHLSMLFPTSLMLGIELTKLPSYFLQEALSVISTLLNVFSLGFPETRISVVSQRFLRRKANETSFYLPSSCITCLLPPSVH